MGWVFAGIVLIGIVVLLWFSRVYLHFSFIYGKRKRTLTVTFRLYRIRFLTKEIKVDDWKTTEKKNEEFAGENFNNKMEKFQYEIKNLFDTIRDTELAVQRLLTIMSIHRLEWHSKVGTGEADTTGMAVGGVWTTKGLMLGILDNLTHVKCEPVISVTPEFNQKCMITKTECMISVRMGQAIHALIKVMQKSSFRKREALMHEGGR